MEQLNIIKRYAAESPGGSLADNRRLLQASNGGIARDVPGLLAYIAPSSLATKVEYTGGRDSSHKAQSGPLVCATLSRA
ncbi:MAG TPA: hypothetical protein DIT39_00330 [Tissierellales bacterium]|nr:hypothetical protein [Tissierellales bacterium]